MKKLVLSGLLVAASLGFGATQGFAGDYGSYESGPRLHLAQYGGGYGGGYSGGHSDCHWERKRVRVWDEYSHSYHWVWRRVRVCY